MAGAGKRYDYVEEIAPDRPDLQLLGVLVTQADQRWRLVRATRRRLAADEMDAFEA